MFGVWLILCVYLSKRIDLPVRKSILQSSKGWTSKLHIKRKFDYPIDYERKFNLQRINCTSITKTEQVVLFQEITGVEYENCTKEINEVRVSVEFMLQHVVRTVTTGL